MFLKLIHLCILLNLLNYACEYVCVCVWDLLGLEEKDEGGRKKNL